MTMTETRVYLQLGDSREEAIKATLTTKATLAKVLKACQAFSENNTVARAEASLMTDTLKGPMFLSPSGAEVYVMAPRTRTVDGVKKSMLTIVRTVKVSDVLSFEVAA